MSPPRSCLAARPHQASRRRRGVPGRLAVVALRLSSSGRPCESRGSRNLRVAGVFGYRDDPLRGRSHHLQRTDSRLRPLGGADMLAMCAAEAGMAGRHASGMRERTERWSTKP